MRTHNKIRSTLAALAAALPLAVSAASFQDVLDTPAKESPLAAKTVLNGLASAGSRVVAVGQRGHIVYSDDGGKSWRQANVPVSSDLVAVAFPSPKKGWAVGHDGVVLHTVDGGVNWTKQLDGRQAGQLLTSYYAALAEKGELGTPEASAALLDEVKRLAGQGAESPLLDVWFADDNTGFVVGAFNLVYRTVDGGKSWEPWFHRTENPKRFHLYGIQRVGNGLYLSGEQGTVLKLDETSNRFVAMNTPYQGSYFGVSGAADAVLVYGLRGNVYRSTDGGKQWNKIDTGMQDSITGASACGSGKMVLVAQSGRMLVSDDRGEHFRSIKQEQTMPATAVLCAADELALIAGMRGVRAQSFK